MPKPKATGEHLLLCEVGDVVAYKKRQPDGTTKEVEAYVVEVIPVGKIPTVTAPAGVVLDYFKNPSRGTLKARDYHSLVIEIPVTHHLAKRHFFWPRSSEVRQLRKGERRGW